MKYFYATAATLLLVLTTQHVCAQGVGHWRFEGSGTIGTVPNVLNPGTHDGTGESGATYSSSTNGHTVWDPVTDTIYSNTSSLSMAGSGLVRVTDDNALDAASFTIEALVRQGNNGGYPAYISHVQSSPRLGWQLDKDPDQDARARFDTSSQTNQVVGSGSAQSLADNRWHHTAVTFDAATKRITHYTDYGVTATRTLNGTASEATNVAADMLFGSTSDLLNSNVDEVRYSNSVLSPNQFLRSVNNGFWRFEGTPGDTIGTVVNSANPGVIDGVGEGGAVYSADRVASAIIDPITNTAHANTSSLDMSGSALVRVANSVDLDAPAFTVEAFVKVQDQGSYPNFVSRFEVNTDGWQLDIDPQEDARARIDTGSGGNSNQVVGSGSSQSLTPGDWHHVALTFDGDIARLYVDGGNLATDNTSGAKANAIGIGNDLLFGGSSWPTGSYVDEVRFSASVLGPNEFLMAAAAPLVDTDIAPGDTIDFGETDVGQIVQELLSLENVGDAGTLLTIDSLDFGGDDPDAFNASGFTPGTTIAAGSDLDLMIQFAPTALDVGTSNATLTVNVDLGPLGTQALLFNLTGSALAVPEPASVVIWSLISLGLVSFGCCRTRRKS